MIPTLHYALVLKVCSTPIKLSLHSGADMWGVHVLGGTPRGAKDTPSITCSVSSGHPVTLDQVEPPRRGDPPGPTLCK